MRLSYSSSILLCALWALAPFCSLSSARSVYVQDRRDASVLLPLSAKDGLQTLTRGAGESLTDAPGEVVADELDSRRRWHASSEDAGSRVAPWEDSQSLDADTLRSYEDGTPNSDNSDPESDSGEKDFTSSPAPIHQGRWRAGILGILAAMALTSVLGYSAYTRRERLKELIAQLPPIPFSLNRLKYIQLPTLSIPTLSVPQRTRRRRLRRAKAGFRPHVSRHRTWADMEGGLLYDYDYDGDYERERGSPLDLPGSSSPTSSSSDSYAQEAEAFDLGADEDFMIGAPRRQSLSPAVTSRAIPGGKSRKGTGMERVLGRWKRSGTGKGAKKGRRSAIASGSASAGESTILFAVGDGDEDLEMELETDEALPLAPTPHRYQPGMGVMKGYGSAG
ncbi:hypothetical protein ACEPAF_5693 [Sanghuangporus sanghuang]